MVVDASHDNAPAQDIEAMLTRLLPTHSLKDAASIVAEQSGKPRKEVYAIALALKQ